MVQRTITDYNKPSGRSPGCTSQEVIVSKTLGHPDPNPSWILFSKVGN